MMTRKLTSDECDDMASESANPEAIERAAHLGAHHAMCPAEVWNILADSIADSDVEPILNRIGKQHRVNLLAVYRDRPESLEMPARDCSTASMQYDKILQWCQRQE